MRKIAKTRATRAKRVKAKPERGNGRKSAHVMLMVGTRKGAFFYHSDAARGRWTSDGPHFLGHIVNQIAIDPRDGRTMLAASKTGHLGPTIFRSTDMGKTWAEVPHPPRFPKPENGAAPRTFEYTFTLVPGHSSEPAVWWAGASPPGLFRSEDGGLTWNEVAELHRHPGWEKWGGYQTGTPDGSMLQWITIDPRDATHMYIVTSEGGVFETRDKCASWRPMNKNVAVTFLPDEFPEIGQDTHCLQIHPSHPDRLYQQSHCGIYRIDRPSDEWTRIGRNMPKEIGDIGFGIVLDPRDADSAWVFPMDGTDVWPRTSVDGKPALYRTADAGATWKRLDRGLPRANAYYTVLRQAFVGDGCDPLGIYFGTTSGEVWASRNAGSSWKRIAEHLPRILSVTPAVL